MRPHRCRPSGQRGDDERAFEIPDQAGDRLPAETIETPNCVVTIDGVELVEPYLDPQLVTPASAL